MSMFEENSNIQREMSSPLTGSIFLGGGIIPDPPSIDDCSNMVETFPYEEYWVSATNWWVNPAGVQRAWTRDSNGTPSSSTGPNSAARGTYYMFTEATSNFNTWFGMESPCVNLTGASAGNFRFAWNMYGSNMGSLYLDAAPVTLEGGIGHWDVLFTRSGNYLSATWIYEDNDLVDYLGGYVKFRFRGLTGGGYRSDMAVDDITLTTTEGSVLPPGVADNGLLIPVKKTIRL